MQELAIHESRDTTFSLAHLFPLKLTFSRSLLRSTTMRRMSFEGKIVLAPRLFGLNTKCMVNDKTQVGMSYNLMFVTDVS